ncbi:hypothetical protein GGF37_004865 [Kickxella alabastrina]|nr:hypothetical protein GGF37_004865 [Kickxella alabastrina]
MKGETQTTVDASEPIIVDQDEHQSVADLFPELTRDQVLNCAFSSWYPKLKKVTFKSIVLKPLQATFLEYLLSDGIVLPDNEAEHKFQSMIANASSDDEDESDWSDEDDEDSGAKIMVDIDASVQQIRKAIEELGGNVFPRMNWSAPTDASWMSCDNTLNCRNPSEVLLLLKGSDKISGDLINGKYLDMQFWEPELVLRQWCNLIPSLEFRCFVRDGHVVGISQIDMQHYSFLEGMAEDIEDKLMDLFTDHVSAAFESESYCFDVYVTRAEGRAYVIDFEPWAAAVDSCLFEWKELLEVGQEGLGLRLFPEGIDAMGHFSAKFSTNRFPIELEGNAFMEALARFKKHSIHNIIKEAEETDEAEEMDETND